MQRVRTNNGKRIIFDIILPVFVLVLFIFVDQITKYYAEKENVHSTVIDAFFYLSYSTNSGAGFSFLADKEWGQTVFKIITPIALLGFIAFYVFAVKKSYGWLKYSLCLIISGTIGNFIDRLLNGKVVDFLSFHFGSYIFPTFNVADICLTVGVIMLIIHYLFLDKSAVFKSKKNNFVNGEDASGGKKDEND